MDQEIHDIAGSNAEYKKLLRAEYEARLASLSDEARAGLYLIKSRKRAKAEAAAKAQSDAAKPTRKHGREEADTSAHNRRNIRKGC